MSLPSRYVALGSDDDDGFVYRPRIAPRTRACSKIQHDPGYRRLASRRSVAASVGRLIAPELRLPVKLYDMEQHYREVKDKWIGFRGGLSE